jgi:hypothetical protein
MAMTIPGRPDFWGKLRNAQRQRRTRLGLTLAVWRDRMPAPMLPVDDPVFPFARAILEEVGAWICACAVPLIPFLAEGAAGMVAMERLIRYLPDDLPILLDARWRDPASAGAYLRAAFEVWGADAVTVAPELPAEAVPHGAANGAIFWWAREAPEAEIAGRHARAARARGLPAGLACSAPLSVPEDLQWVALEVQDPADLSRMAGGPPPAVVFVGEPILYASRRMDFREAARRAAKHWAQQLAAWLPVDAPDPEGKEYISG